MPIKSVHLPTGIELINMIMSMEIKKFKKETDISISVVTLLTQAVNVVNEDNFFLYRGDND